MPCGRWRPLARPLALNRTNGWLLRHQILSYAAGLAAATGEKNASAAVESAAAVARQICATSTARTDRADTARTGWADTAQ
ncbi:hypothetical protein EDD25_3414 [Cryobacterium psychrophilum]|nr:hypothetical protein EDD25_3414 [Cryobacterium psychrophilum]